MPKECEHVQSNENEYITQSLYLEPPGKGSQETDPDRKPDECCHAAVRDGWSEGDLDAVLPIADCNALFGHHRQLLEG